LKTLDELLRDAMKAEGSDVFIIPFSPVSTKSHGRMVRISEEKVTLPEIQVLIDRAYELARKGQEVELAAKPIHIDEIELTAFDPVAMQMSIRVVCGKGTYIRSLARDIGYALGSGAFLTALCRTRVGDVRIEDCLTFDDFPAWLEENVKE
jgi:tRNA U55 pseudouridine synthase TruB